MEGRYEPSVGPLAELPTYCTEQVLAPRLGSGLLFRAFRSTPTLKSELSEVSVKPQEGSALAQQVLFRLRRVKPLSNDKITEEVLL